MKSQKPILTSVLVAGVVLLGYANLPFGPGTAKGQQVLPGGRAAHLRSYVVVLGPSATDTAIASVEGSNGTIITDVLVTGGGGGTFRVFEDSGGGNVEIAQFHADDAQGRHRRFVSGIPASAGSELVLQNTASSTVTVTLLGYTY